MAALAALFVPAAARAGTEKTLHITAPNWADGVEVQDMHVYFTIKVSRVGGVTQNRMNFPSDHFDNVTGTGTDTINFAGGTLGAKETDSFRIESPDNLKPNQELNDTENVVREVRFTGTWNGKKYDVDHPLYTYAYPQDAAGDSDAQKKQKAEQRQEFKENVKGFTLNEFYSFPMGGDATLTLANPEPALGLRYHLYGFAVYKDLPLSRFNLFAFMDASGGTSVYSAPEIVIEPGATAVIPLGATLPSTYALAVASGVAVENILTGEMFLSPIPAAYAQDATPEVTVSGTITLSGCVNPAQTLAFTFRPTDGSPPYTRAGTLASDGSFRLADIPARVYTVHIKGGKWLAQNVTVDASGGDVTGVMALLRPGDIDNDNTVNIQDLGLLADAFLTTPASANWNENADLNCDSMVNIADLGLLADSFGKSGDP
jgi:hypothetical protein